MHMPPHSHLSLSYILHTHTTHTSLLCYLSTSLPIPLSLYLPIHPQDNLIRGRFLAELTREVFSDLEQSKYQHAEMRISIYGRKQVCGGTGGTLEGGGLWGEAQCSRGAVYTYGTALSTTLECW